MLGCLAGRTLLTEEEKTETKLKVQKINMLKWRLVTRRVTCHVPDNPYRPSDRLTRPPTGRTNRGASCASEGAQLA